jgi:prepilin-type N-terminal cleavage/methylation domain-containing protein
MRALKDKGFSLIEILVALGVTGFGLLMAYTIIQYPQKNAQRSQYNVNVETEITSAMEVLVELLHSAVSVKVSGSRFYVMTNQATGREAQVPPEFAGNYYCGSGSGWGGTGRFFRTSFSVGDPAGSICAGSAAPQPARTVPPANDGRHFRIWLADWRPRAAGNGCPLPPKAYDQSVVTGTVINEGCLAICAVPDDTTTSCPLDGNSNVASPTWGKGVYFNIDELAVSLIYADCPTGAGPLCQITHPNGTALGPFFPPINSPNILGDAYRDCYGPAGSVPDRRTGSLSELCQNTALTKDLVDASNNYVKSEMLVRLRIIGEDLNRLTDRDNNNDNSGGRPFLQTAVYLRNWGSVTNFLAVDTP